MKTVRYLMDSPLGPITIAGRRDAITGVYFAQHRHAPSQGSLGDIVAAAQVDRWPALADAAAQLAEYFDGTRADFDLPLDAGGTPFQQRVWLALSTIGFGTTRSYGQIAEQIGSAGSARAVGMANGRNPISIVVPCHRVIGGTGALTGYGGGSARKQALLDLEARHTGASLF
ncbi:MAG: methylated-DNA--[protein]-cysteine S-methyltransferase [Ornithinimicrobium sp.]